MKQTIAMILLYGLFHACSSETEQSQINRVVINNMSFEKSVGDEPDWKRVPGWEGVSGGIRNDGFYSPLDGSCYAYQLGGGTWIYQESNHPIQAGKKYTLKLWARCVNQPGNRATASLQTGFFADGKEVVNTIENVNTPRLKGAAATEANDDGANVWIDGEFRHQFSEVHMYQPITSDPIKDPWLVLENSGYDRISGDLGWAVGNVIAGDQKFLYGTRYRDRYPFYSSLTLTRVLSENLPDYQWSDPLLVLEHDRTEFPWVLDAHVYYDDSTGRLWMSWGGGICYVSEMDPQTGMLLGDPESKEFNDHPEGMHTAVATWPETRSGWEGDEWSCAWNEGPALFKHGGYWYFFASYGHLGLNYTIRMGRGTSPTGPFYDKQGLNMMEFDEERNVYGNSLLLGAEGEQLVPGHPHIWEEKGKFYLGYDFRKDSEEEMDYMGIRKLYWVDGWPTIWKPVEVTFNADDYPEFVGKKLGIQFRNAGEEGSELAVDKIGVSIDEVQ